MKQFYFVSFIIKERIIPKLIDISFKRISFGSKILEGKYFWITSSRMPKISVKNIMSLYFKLFLSKIFSLRKPNKPYSKI